MTGLALRDRGTGYNLLVGPVALDDPLEVVERSLREATSRIRHGDRVVGMLAPRPGARIASLILAEEVDEWLWQQGFRPPDGEQAMTAVDHQGVVYLRLQERSPDMSVLLPVLLVGGLAATPLIFYLFKEENQEGENKLKKFLPFIILGGLVLGGVVLAFAVSQKR